MKRFTGALITAGIGVALLVVYVARDYRSEKGAKAIATTTARARVAACLIGQPSSDVADQRLRAVLLEAHDDPTWPARCVPYVEALADASANEALPLLESKTRANVLDFKVRGLVRPSYADVPIDFAAVTRDVTRPKEPTVPSDPPFLHTGNIERVVGERDLVVQVDRDVACQLRADDGGIEPVARCSFLADSVADPQERAVLVKGDGAPLVHDYRTVAPWAGGAAMIAGTLPITPSRAGDAVYAIAGIQTRKTALVHRGGTTRTQPLDQPTATADEMAIVSDQLVWTERGHIFTRSLAGAVGAVTDLGTAPSGLVRDTCSYGSTLAAVHQREDAWYVALRIGETWKYVGPAAVHADARVHCFADRVVLMSTKRDDDGVLVSRADCTLAGCTNAETEVAVKAGLADAVPIGDETMLVWAHDGVWARRARMADLGAAKQIPIFNGFATSADYVAQSTLVQGLEAHVRGASVVVLVYDGGVRAVHLREGRAVPVSVVYE